MSTVVGPTLITLVVVGLTLGAMPAYKKEKRTTFSTSRRSLRRTTWPVRNSLDRIHWYGIWVQRLRGAMLTTGMQ
jgi:hypothetical protein